MEITEIVAVASVAIALVSLAIQQHLTRQQSKSEARARHYERTQMLLLKALEDPELLEGISGKQEEDQKQRRFRQLWFNHVEMIFRQRKLFDRLHWDGTLNDVRGFLNMPAMREHWQGNQQYYADDYRAFIDQHVIKKAEPPPNEAPPRKNLKLSSS
ncbi:DUF6082 family protein [Roseibacillus persicicus]|uniref:DUF6082 family protein n=1 Tax=Roseibacillus persicicus TaxID=454148 RepID=UPI00398B6695